VNELLDTDLNVGGAVQDNTARQNKVDVVLLTLRLPLEQ